MEKTLSIFNKITIDTYKNLWNKFPEREKEFMIYLDMLGVSPSAYFTLRYRQRLGKFLKLAVATLVRDLNLENEI
jgi:hypothetical protein